MSYACMKSALPWTDLVPLRPCQSHCATRAANSESRMIGSERGSAAPELVLASLWEPANDSATLLEA